MDTTNNNIIIINYNIFIQRNIHVTASLLVIVVVHAKPDPADCGAQHKMAAPKTASGPRSVPWLSLCLLSYIFGLVESGMLCRYKKETCI